MQSVYLVFGRMSLLSVGYGRSGLSMLSFSVSMLATAMFTVDIIKYPQQQEQQDEEEFDDLEYALEAVNSQSPPRSSSRWRSCAATCAALALSIALLASANSNDLPILQRFALNLATYSILLQAHELTNPRKHKAIALIFTLAVAAVLTAVIPNYTDNVQQLAVAVHSDTTTQLILFIIPTIAANTIALGIIVWLRQLPQRIAKPVTSGREIAIAAFSIWWIVWALFLVLSNFVDGLYSLLNGMICIYGTVSGSLYLWIFFKNRPKATDSLQTGLLSNNLGTNNLHSKITDDREPSRVSIIAESVTNEQKESFSSEPKQVSQIPHTEEKLEFAQKEQDQHTGNPLDLKTPSSQISSISSPINSSSSTDANAIATPLSKCDPENLQVSSVSAHESSQGQNPMVNSPIDSPIDHDEEFDSDLEEEVTDETLAKASSYGFTTTSPSSDVANVNSRSQDLGKTADTPIDTQELERLQEMKSAEAKETVIDEKAVSREEKRTNILDEIIQTEITYVSKLSTLVSEFVTPLTTLAEIGELKQSRQEIQALFKGISPIYNFHQAFSERLKGSDRIGKTFKDFAQFFKMYTDYVNEYDSRNEMISKFKQNKKGKFAKFVKDKRQMNVEDLASLMITPVQRIPRYLLLLRELIKYTDDDGEKSELQEAFDIVEKSCQHVNNAKKETENSVKLTQLQSMMTNFPGELIKPGRRLIREEELLRKVSVANIKSKKSTLVFLFNDLLVWANKNHSFVGRFALWTITMKKRQKRGNSEAARFSFGKQKRSSSPGNSGNINLNSGIATYVLEITGSSGTDDEVYETLVLYFGSEENRSAFENCIMMSKMKYLQSSKSRSSRISGTLQVPSDSELSVSASSSLQSPLV